MRLTSNQYLDLCQEYCKSVERSLKLLSKKQMLMKWTNVTVIEKKLKFYERLLLSFKRALRIKKCMQPRLLVHRLLLAIHPDKCDHPFANDATTCKISSSKLNHKFEHSVHSVNTD